MVHCSGPIIIGKLVTAQCLNASYNTNAVPLSVSSKPYANEVWAHNMQEVEYQFNQALPAGAFIEKLQPKCISNSTAVTSHSCLPCKQTALMAPACWAIQTLKRQQNMKWTADH